MGIEVIAAAILGTLSVVFGVFYYGQSKGYKEAKSETTSKALDEIVKVTQQNLLIKERDDAIRNEITGPWGDRDVIELPKDGSSPD